MSRIYGEHVDIDREAVRAFFEMRGRNVNPEAPLTATMYQDHAPQIAEQRDRYEKEHVLPLLKLSPQDRVLDIGCGIGRWADVIAPLASHYHGTDFSESLVHTARQRHAGRQNVTFQQLPAEETAPAALASAPPFSRIIIAGLLAYLNDADVLRVLACAAACAADDVLIYLREPLALEQRLTLNHLYSDELHHEYNAIYRTVGEVQAALDATLAAAGFRWTHVRPLYPDALNNRKETMQHILIGERP